MSIVEIILSIISFSFLVLIGWFYHKSQLTEIRHESELKELGDLFKIKVGEYDKKINEYELYIVSFQKYFDSFSQIIRISDARMKQIDAKGSFKSDDEVGFFFRNLQEIQETLNDFDFTKPHIEKEVKKEEKLSPMTVDGKSIPDNAVLIPFEQVQEILKK